MSDPIAIHSLSLMKELEKVGLIPNLTRRVIIDMSFDGVPILYYETVGDERLLSIDWAKIAPEIKVQNKPDSPDYDPSQPQVVGLHGINRRRRDQQKTKEAKDDNPIDGDGRPICICTADKLCDLHKGDSDE